MEPSEEFCVSGCTCTLSLGPGSVVEEKVKRGETAKKKKDKKRKEKTNKDNYNYNYNKNWSGVWERAAEKKNCRPQLPTFLSFPPLHLIFFFFAFSLLQPEPVPTQGKL